MHRLLPLLALPLLLSACDQNTTPPASEAAPAAEVAAPVEPVTPAPAPEPAVAAPAASSNLDTGPITGSWATTPANCATPIMISASSFAGAENACDINQLTDNGDGTMTAALSCQSEGQTATESVKMTPLFGPTGEGIRIEYLDRGGEKITVFRCGK